MMPVALLPAVLLALLALLAAIIIRSVWLLRHHPSGEVGLASGNETLIGLALVAFVALSVFVIVVVLGVW
jgi:hypothetical protein